MQESYAAARAQRVRILAPGQDSAGQSAEP